MARSIEEIMNQTLDAKNSQAELSELNSTSKVALYRLFSYCTAVAIHFHERTWELYKLVLEKIAEEANVGTAKWLARKVLEYQHGSTLSVLNDTVKYNIVDLTKRIITRCSIRENTTRRISIKVAKDAETEGDLTKLDDTEIAGLKSYLNQIKMAGTKFQIVSLNADRVQMSAEIYYDAAYVPDDVKARIITNLKEYLKGIDFSGNMYLQKVIDTIQKTEGVKDVYLSSLIGREATEPAGVVVERFYESYAGYLIEEDLEGLTFNDTLEMKPFDE